MLLPVRALAETSPVADAVLHPPTSLVDVVQRPVHSAKFFWTTLGAEIG